MMGKTKTRYGTFSVNKRECCLLSVSVKPILFPLALQCQEGYLIGVICPSICPQLSRHSKIGYICCSSHWEDRFYPQMSPQES